MFRLRNLVLLAMVLTGIADESQCRAQAPAYCLEYPLYYDGSANYLFVAEQYDGDPVNCTDQGEVYMWVTSTQLSQIPNPTLPQICGMGYCTGYGALLAKKEKKDAATSGFPVTLPPSTFNLGDNLNGAVNTILKPKRGITVVWTGIVWVQAKGTVIPVKLFKAYLDYKSAGIPDKAKWPGKTQVDPILIGVEVSPAGLQQTAPVYTPTAATTYSGTITNVPDLGGTDDFKIITNTPLQ